MGLLHARALLAAAAPSVSSLWMQLGERGSLLFMRPESTHTHTQKSQPVGERWSGWVGAVRWLSLARSAVCVINKLRSARDDRE